MTDDSFDDLIIDYADARFELRPHPTYSDLMRINALANELGYQMPFSMKQYSLEDVQEKLRSEGPAAFLGTVWLQEDVSPKAPVQSADQFVAERLARLAPAGDLVIVDPYLFPPRPDPSTAEYGQRLASLIAPLLAERATVTAIVNERANAEVEDATLRALVALSPNATLTVRRTEDFHDRFWIADGARGVVVGASLNGIGRRIFFIDQMRDADVAAVIREVNNLER